MLGPLVAIAPMLLGVALLVATLALLPHRRRQVAIDEVTYPGLADLRRRTSLARVLGVAAGLLAAVAVAGGTHEALALGRGLMLAPTVFGVVLVVALAIGDRAAHGSARGSGAGLDRRRARDLLPRPLTGLVTAAAVTLAALLAAAAAVGSADDLGRPGRELAYSTPDGALSGAAGPWPGAFYGATLAPGLLVLLVVAGVALGLVASRPSGGQGEVRRVDAIVRRREAESVVAATGLSISVTLVGIASTAAQALYSTASSLPLNGYPAPWWLVAAGWCAFAVTLAALPLGLYSGVALLVPGAAAPRGRRHAVLVRAER